MTELETLIMAAIPPGYAVRVATIRDQVGADHDAVQSALHRLDDAGHVIMRQGYYQLSAAAKAARQEGVG